MPCPRSPSRTRVPSTTGQVSWGGIQPLTQGTNERQVLSPPMQRGRSSSLSVALGMQSSASPAQPSNLLEHTVSRQSTIETLRAPQPQRKLNHRRSTLSGPTPTASEHAQAAQQNLGLTVHDTATESAERAIMGKHEEAHGPMVEDYRCPSRSLRIPSVLDSEEGRRTLEYGRRTSSAVPSVGLHGSRVSVASQSTVQTDPEPVPPTVPGGATKEKGFTSTDAVRAALLAAPQIDSGRATRIAQLRAANPQPREEVAPMIVEKRVDYLPLMNSMEDPTDGRDAKKSNPLKVVPSIGKLGRKGRRGHHTVQPTFPTPAGTVTGDPVVEQPLAKKAHRRSLNDRMGAMGTVRTSMEGLVRSGQVPMVGKSRPTTGPKRFPPSRKGTARDRNNNEACIVM